ncbi:MAG: recombinase family protein [Tenericutes bacterium]|nr:recombinase family protein [Mycoplasmatota bacterium]
MDLYTIRNMLSQGKSIYDLPLRVTFYARVSTDRYEQLNSLENQVMYFENFIKEQENWTFVDGYVDEGISGTSVKKREDFLRMVDDAKKKKFDLILTKEISRFSRNTLDSIKYTQELLSCGVGVHFLSDNINTFQPDSELRLTIMSSIAQEEIRKLSERVRFGYKRSVEKGIVPGSNNIYGYTKNKGKLVIDEEQAKFIRLIFETYVSENIGVHRLGFKLFEEYGVTNYSGKPIAGTVIKNIIRNPKYKGYFCAHKETTVDYHDRKRKRFKRDEWIVYKDNETCPPIVSEELWDKANEILDARSKKHDQINKNNKYNKFPFSGLMHCHFDGATFVRGTYQIGKGDRSRRRKFWACNNYRIHGKKKTEGCNSPVLYYEELVEVCKKILNMILVCQDDLISEINDMFSDIRTKKDYKKEIKLIDEKLFKTNNEKKELIMMRMRKEIDLKEYNSLKDDVDEKINSLEETKRKLIEEEQNEQSSEKNFEEFKKKINDMVLSDDEKILEIAQVFFEDIRVESIKDDETDQKVILHAKLNVSNREDDTFDFNKFLLLFCTRQGCCYCSCLLYSRQHG